MFAVLAIFVARPVALWVSFLRSGLGMREQAAAMWFGPKGFASVVYGLLVLESGIAAADEIFHLVALTIVLSILLHSSTDVVVARALRRARRRHPPGTACCGGGSARPATLSKTAGRRSPPVAVPWNGVDDDTDRRRPGCVLGTSRSR